MHILFYFFKRECHDREKPSKKDIEKFAKITLIFTQDKRSSFIAIKRVSCLSKSIENYSCWLSRRW